MENLYLWGNGPFVTSTTALTDLLTTLHDESMISQGHIMILVTPNQTVLQVHQWAKLLMTFVYSFKTEMHLGLLS